MTEEAIEIENKEIAKQYKKLLKISYRTLSKEDKKLIRNAFDIAVDAHKEQRRKSGEAYINHPLAVATILSEMRMDHQCLMAALLHDVLEDTGVAKDQLGAEFDEQVAELVDGVSKLSSMFQSRAEAQAENFQKILQNYYLNCKKKIYLYVLVGMELNY